MHEFDENLIQIKKNEVLGKLPNLFTMEDGSRVEMPEQWKERRKELFQTAVEMQYGKMPPQPEFLEVEPLDENLAIRNYRIVTGTRQTPTAFTMRVIGPNKPGVFPAIVDGDLCWRYAFDKEYLDINELNIKETSFIENILIVLNVLIYYKLDINLAKNVIKSFKQVKYRNNVIKYKNTIFVNDGKSTSSAASKYCFDQYKGNRILILGGIHKSNKFNLSLNEIVYIEGKYPSSKDDVHPLTLEEIEARKLAKKQSKKKNITKQQTLF